MHIFINSFNVQLAQFTVGALAFIATLTVITLAGLGSYALFIKAISLFDSQS